MFRARSGQSLGRKVHGAGHVEQLTKADLYTRSRGDALFTLGFVDANSIVLPFLILKTRGSFEINEMFILTRNTP